MVRRSLKKKGKKRYLPLFTKCPVYDQIRRDCLPNIDFDIATADTFYSLFNSSEQQVLSLAKYVYNAFIMRENILKEMKA